MKKELALGVDIGGTNTVFGLVDHNGIIIREFKLKTTLFAQPGELVANIYDEVTAFMSRNSGQFNLLGIGIGAPNGNFFSGSIEHAPNLSWKGIIPLADMFTDRFGIPVTLTNDANAAAVGEMIFGNAKGMRNFILITIGTGLGSGIVVDGKIVYGHDGFAGELGHTLVKRGGRLCGCGRKGCLETYVSAGGMVQTYFEVRKKHGIAHTKSKNAQITSQEVCEAAMNNDKAALATFKKTCDYLAYKLADAIAITSPEAVFLFGGVTRAGELITGPTIQALEKYLNPVFRKKVKILISGLNDKNAAVLGAASMVFDPLK